MINVCSYAVNAFICSKLDSKLTDLGLYNSMYTLNKMKANRAGNKISYNRITDTDTLLYVTAVTTKSNLWMTNKQKK